jgi:hypothetical protein
LAAQATDAEREVWADIVLNGAGTPAHLQAQVDAWLASVGWSQSPADSAGWES